MAIRPYPHSRDDYRMRRDLAAAEMSKIPLANTRRGLASLVEEIDDAASRARPSTWVRRRLARGAVVSLMVDEFEHPGEGEIITRRVLLLSRPKAPVGERDAKAWNVEVNTFLKWFDAATWDQVFELPAAAFEGVEIAVWSAFREPI